MNSTAHFAISQHAEEEMRRRGIPRQLLDSVLANPEQVVPVHAGKWAYQSRVRFEDGRMFLLRAMVATDVEPHLVVTVYRTSKVGKYWRTP